MIATTDNRCLCGSLNYRVYTPSKRVWKSEWPQVSDFKLADHDPLSVDILLSADDVTYVIRSVRSECTIMEEPVGIETVFGCLLMGRTGAKTTESTNTLVTSLETIDATLRHFWVSRGLLILSYENKCTLW